MQKASFIDCGTPESSTLNEYLPFLMPITKPSRMINQFTIEEIKANIQKHQEAADACMEIWNSENPCMELRARLKSGKNRFVKIEGKEFEAVKEAFKKAIYDLAVYHRNKRVAWDIALECASEETIDNNTQNL
jgi:hypothetical protein